MKKKVNIILMVCLAILLAGGGFWLGNSRNDSGDRNTRPGITASPGKNDGAKEAQKLPDSGGTKGNGYGIAKP